MFISDLTDINDEMYQGTLWTYGLNSGHPHVLTFSHCAHEAGGIMVIGQIAVINVRVKASQTLSGDQTVVSGIPIPIAGGNAMALSAYTNTGSLKVAYINKAGNTIVVQGLTANEYVIISGVYICNKP